MRNFFTLLLVLNSNLLFSQFCDDYCLYFEDTICLNRLTIDTISVSNNLWQIGQPNKPAFNPVPSTVNAIVTDTINSYPINNYSVFIIENLATMGDMYGFRDFNGMYNVQSDSLNDFGKMEFSPDNGMSWIDIINDTIYNAFLWNSPKPVLTGNSQGWQYFDVLMLGLGFTFNFQLGDTILFRFTFSSDSITENLGGLMYDAFCYFNFVEGISETRFKPIKSKIFPNPSTDFFTIKFDNPKSDNFELSVYDIKSHLIFKKDNITDSSISFETKTFRPGTYVYKLTNLKAQQRSWGKFIMTE
jgi:hypothetical protein